MKKSDRMRRAKEFAEEMGEAARQKAEEMFDAARDRAEGAYEAAYEVAEDGIDDARVFLRKQWRDRPLATAASAVAIGVVLGLALSAGSRR